MTDFDYWVWHFKQNVTHLDHIDFQLGGNLTPEEFLTISRSIAIFQHGEYSEGKHLMSFAKKFTTETGDWAYEEAIKHFIREEQRHAMVLGEYMKVAGLPKIQNNWVDKAFRFLRKLSNHENSIRVLTTAEIIAAVYYRGLRDATNDECLKAICQQLLDDEAYHLRFQAYTLHAINVQRPRGLTSIWNLYHRVLLSGTIALVWLGHRKVLKAGKISFSDFWNGCFQEFRKVRDLHRYYGLQRRLRLLQKSLHHQLAYEDAHH